MKIPSLATALVLAICATLTTARPPAFTRYSPPKRTSQLKTPSSGKNTRPMGLSRYIDRVTKHIEPKIKNTDSLPFKILITAPSSSSVPSLIEQPLYLLPNGSTTTESTLAATCHTSITSRLYCGNSKTPIGAAADAATSLLSGVRGSEEVSVDVKPLVHGGWEISGLSEVKKGEMKKKELRWQRNDKKENAKFVFRDELIMGSGNGGGTIWATFGGDEEKRAWEGVDVNLVALFE